MKSTFSSKGGVYCFFKPALILLLFTFSFFSSESFAQTKWYYNGAGALNNVASWGTNTNGTGGTLADFTSGGRLFIIQNTAAVTLNGIWNVGNSNFGNAGGDSVAIGNPATPTPPIVFTIASGAALTVNKARTISVSLPSSGNQKIVYQNNTVLSLGAIADTSLEIVFDGATITSSSASTFGSIKLINNANVNMGAASLTTKNLFVEAGSTLSGPIGSSSNFIAISSGGSVVINGTFKAGRSGGLYSTKVAIPVVPVSTNGTLLYQDSTIPPNFTLGPVSTIEFYRGTNNQSGNQTIESLNYYNLVLSNFAVASNKTFGSGTTTVAGSLIVNMPGTIVTPTTQNITLKPGAKLVINSATAFPTPTTTGRFTLQSDATGTASIATMVDGASIVGDVTVQQYFPAGFRKYRFLSHPFTTSRSLGMLTDDIDVTGNTAGTSLSTGQTTGYGLTPTSTNNPSAYLFNTATADGDATNDAGWKAFIDDTTRSWKAGSGIRVLIRGRKNQSNTLNGFDTIPNATTIDMTGTVNFGPDTIKLVTGGTGATAGFNLVGNPYPSPVNIGAVLNATSNIGTSIYLRNPQTGSYITVNPIPANYILPAYSAFFVKATAATELIFNENNKSSCTTCPTLFRNAPIKNHIEIQAQKDGEMYDNLNLNFGNNYSEKFDDKTDAVKLMNNGLNIYALSSDKQKLAADYRNLNTVTIPLGIDLPKANGIETYTLKVSDFNIENSVKLILHDKLLNKYVSIEKDAVYHLTINPAIASSVGENRLEIIIKK
ncbi:MAG: hypothetical protein ACOVO1_09460 [Chitinophagaceae bacterium]